MGIREIMKSYTEVQSFLGRHRHRRQTNVLRLLYQRRDKSNNKIEDTLPATRAQTGSQNIPRLSHFGFVLR